jgi:hypothetical protein
MTQANYILGHKPNFLHSASRVVPGFNWYAISLEELLLINFIQAENIDEDSMNLRENTLILYRLTY